MKESVDFWLTHPGLNIQINPSENIVWNFFCYPKNGTNIRLQIQPLGSFTSEIHALVTAKLLGSAGTSEPLGEVTGWYKKSSVVLDVLFAHEKLLSSAERLMPDGTLTIYIQIKILPSKATVVHGSLQDAAPVSVTGKNVFADMVDSFVDVKLGSILIIFQDGKQKCHAFPLATRNACGEKLSFSFTVPVLVRYIHGALSR